MPENSATTHSTSTQIEVGGVQLHLQNVRLRADVMLDEVSLESGDIHITEAEGGDGVTARAAETKFHIMLTEPHINEFLAVNLPTDGALRNVRLALLSGKVRISGQVVKSIMHLPVTLDAVPLIENGVRVKLDCQATTAAGITLPAALVDLVELFINDNPKLPLDLAKLPIPVRLDEIRCEPGRLHVTGRAKLQWPPVFASPAVAPFSPRETPAYLRADNGSAEALPAGDDAHATPALPA
jgi:hypothetical protein